MQPQVPIDVDEKTGVWTTDGMPMLYVPRHFFNNNHVAVEEVLGREKYAEILYQAGYKSAFYWCDKEAETHQLKGMAVYEHYLQRLSQRGWGKFSFDQVDVDAAYAEIKLEYSSFVLSEVSKPGKQCYMFAGWFAGAMDWVTQKQGRKTPTLCCETQCGGDGHEHCIFTVKPLPDMQHFGRT